jgi:hypothetical protein
MAWIQLRERLFAHYLKTGSRIKFCESLCERLEIFARQRHWLQEGEKLNQRILETKVKTNASIKENCYNFVIALIMQHLPSNSPRCKITKELSLFNIKSGACFVSPEGLHNYLNACFQDETIPNSFNSADAFVLSACEFQHPCLEIQTLFKKLFGQEIVLDIKKLPAYKDTYKIYEDLYTNRYTIDKKITNLQIKKLKPKLMEEMFRLPEFSETHFSLTARVKETLSSDKEETIWFFKPGMFETTNGTKEEIELT